MIESARKLSLKIVTLYSRTSAFHEKLGASTTIEAMAQVKIDSSSEKALVSAAEQFLGLGEEGIAKVAQQVLDGHVRAVLGTLEAEHIFAEREKLAEKLRLLVGADLGMVGLTLVTLTLGSHKEIDAPALVAR